jgi:hypothetical protein
MTLLAVLYVYIAKIAVLRSMPSGEMNWFGSFALLVYVGLWMGLRDMEWRPAQLFVSWGWALLVPVVAVQLFGVFIRIHAYGLTATRVVSLACTGIGVFALVCAALRTSPRKVFAITALVAVILSITPANPIDAANLDQTMRLRHVVGAAGMVDQDGKVTPLPSGSALTDEQRQQVSSAWAYLRDSERGFIRNPLVEDLCEWSERVGFEELFGFAWTDGGEREGEGDAHSAWRFYEWRSGEASVDVSGFTQVYDLEGVNVQGSVYGLRPDDGYRLRLEWNDGTRVDVELAGLVDGLLQDPPPVAPGESSGEGYMSADDLRVDAGDGRVLALKKVSVELEEDRAIEATVEGWLLVP